VVMLALAGCGSHPRYGISALDAPAVPADHFSGSANLRIKADSARLLVEENDYAFYAGLPDDPADGGSVCLIVHRLGGEDMSAGCGGNVSLGAVEVGSFGLKAKLTADGYDASRELAEGWRQLHQNLLVRGL
jgi:hypothetical protein